MAFGFYFFRNTSVRFWIPLAARNMRNIVDDGFKDVQRGAMSVGALGCSISGAGPTVFAWAEIQQADPTPALVTVAGSQVLPFPGPPALPGPTFQPVRKADWWVPAFPTEQVRGLTWISQTRGVHRG